jgi:phosphate transport system regulatory protein PhoU
MMILQSIFGTFDLWLAIEIVTKVLLSLVLGGLVGFDRERRNMPAGVRTFMLVSVGSCMFTFMSYHAFGDGGDPGRVAAQIVSGIGFLGAAVVIRREGTIYGLTSAAGVWAVAAVGMAVGTGSYFLALFGAVSIYVILAVIRQWFKAELLRSTRRTLNVELRDVRDRITAMGQLSAQAIELAVHAFIEDDHALAQRIIDDDAAINHLRYTVEQECVEILRGYHPIKIELRTVLAATHIVTNLERIGDYGKEIAEVRLSMGHQRLLEPMDDLVEMTRQVCTLLQEVLVAFGQDDVPRAERVADQIALLDEQYASLVEHVTDRMTDKKTKHFERGAGPLTVAYHIKRAGERVTNIAERIVFVRTGALAELDREGQPT